MTVLNDVKEEMKAAITHLGQDLKNIRTGRANPGLVENVLVEVYGSQMRLTDLATISVPEPQQLLVSPYDAGNTAAIGKAIERANLGMQCIVEGNVVRLNIPPMDQSIRDQMVKECKKKSEEAKVSIRNTRRKFNDQVREMKSSGEIPEDVMKKEEKDIQTLTDDFCKQADEITGAKEKEIASI